MLPPSQRYRAPQAEKPLSPWSPVPFSSGVGTALGRACGTGWCPADRVGITLLLAGTGELPIHHTQAREEEGRGCWGSQSPCDPRQGSSRCCSRGSGLQACALTITFSIYCSPNLHNSWVAFWADAGDRPPPHTPVERLPPRAGCLHQRWGWWWRVSVSFICNGGIWVGAESCQALPVLHTPLSKSSLENTERGLMLIANCLSFENLKQHLLDFPHECLMHNTARAPERKLCREYARQATRWTNDPAGYECRS